MTRCRPCRAARDRAAGRGLLEPDDAGALHARAAARRGRARPRRAVRRRHRQAHRALAEGQVRRSRAGVRGPHLVGRRSTSRALEEHYEGLRAKVADYLGAPRPLRRRRVRRRRSGAPDLASASSRRCRTTRSSRDDVHHADRRASSRTSSRRRSSCTRPALEADPREDGTRTGTFIVLHPTQARGADRRHLLRRRDQEVDLHAAERLAAARGRLADALLGERRRRRRRRDLLRPLRHRQDDALGRPRAAADRRRRARLGRQRASSTSRAAATRR